jgi:hypothetical protein
VDAQLGSILGFYTRSAVVNFTPPHWLCAVFRLNACTDAYQEELGGRCLWCDTYQRTEERGHGSGTFTRSFPEIVLSVVFLWLLTVFVLLTPITKIQMFIVPNLIFTHPFPLSSRA